MGPRETKIRVVNSRGYAYIQEVKYIWDKERKRGMTKVIRHLGPKDPVNQNRYRNKHPLTTAASLLTHQSSGKKRPSRRTLAKRRDYPSLSPSQELKVNIVDTLKHMPEGGNRRAVYDKLDQQGSAPFAAEEDARTLVGVALTALKRSGVVVAKGKGVRGNPFVYFLR
jgi:hypothetical protein